VSALPYAVAAWIFLIGLYGVVTSRNLIPLVISLNVAQSSTLVLLVAIGYKRAATAPIFYDIGTTRPVVDPVVQALTLTDVVVGVTVVALLLTLVVQIHKETGTLDPEALNPMRG
jgi:multicomponent Na+:H+ antiporter subunit C